MASVVRVTSFNQINVGDETYSGVAPALWTETEQSLGITCACLPCLGPLLGHLLRSKTEDTVGSGTKSRFVRLTKFSTKRSIMGHSAGDGSRAAGFARLSEDNIDPATSAYTAKASTMSHHEPSHGTGAILKSPSIETYYQEPERGSRQSVEVTEL